ncbi:MAG: undecaprenyl/decaprenyl-phosphate alpha-N-acetylglucosaminyl 1-phosphate transferase, partial [Chloroflexota bacterium]|nr:undecaprenyl/decaprenyl-phosphate alpha-N-acetylglucosaminyl 1-phosphate transferase [Chloroflexota bacterium]
AYLPLLLGASTLGFLPYNVHPARIFMGDSGAMFIGFTLAVISIIGGAKLAVALLVIGIPMLDGVYMIIYRLYRGKSPLSADRGHLHHRLLDIGLSQQQVVMVFLLLCGLFGLISLPLTPPTPPTGTGTGMLDFFGIPLRAGLLKLGALVAMVIVLATLMLYIARRQFDRLRVGAAQEAERANEPN